MSDQVLSGRARWSAPLRVLAATAGAFGFAVSATLALSLILPLIGATRADAVTMAFMASSLLFAAASLAAFHARSGLRAWGGIIASGAPLALYVWACLPVVTP